MAGSLLLPAGVLGLAGCTGTSRSPELQGFDGKIMGTGYSVRFGTELPKGLSEQVHSALLDVDAHMSTWRVDSELNRFNTSSDKDWIPLSPSTTQVLSQAMKTSAESGGAFDVTIGPLVDLWGFGAGAANGSATARIPAQRDIGQSLSKVGYESLELNLDTNAVRKFNVETQLDLSGIAKGHAVDRVAAVIDAHGIDSYLVEVGGELKASGLKPDGTHWRVAIERPAAGQRDVYRVLELNDQAIATSGDYRNFFNDGGKRYSHSIDPRTGKPVNHQLASVSVVADTTMAADALSTALMIMGPDDAIAFANRQGVAAHFILKSGPALEEVFSDSFKPLVS